MTHYNKLKSMYCPHIWGELSVFNHFKILIHFSINELDVFIQNLLIQKHLKRNIEYMNVEYVYI